MLKIYTLKFAVVFTSLIATLFTQAVFAQNNKIKKDDFFDSPLSPQVFISYNYIPTIGASETYLRKGYSLNIGFVKPFYAEHADNFARIFSVTAEAGYGRSDAEGALKDIKNQKAAISLAVPNSLNPAYTSTIKKAVLYNLGAGLRQDLHFNKFNISITATTGYQRVERPAFTLEDKTLTFTVNGDKVLYARAAAADASGLYCKPGISLGFRILKNTVLFANADYTFGPKFKEATQTYLFPRSTDNDAYFNVSEIRAGSIMELPLDKNTNLFTAGIGIKYYLAR
jgi:hypothetical protein